MQVTYLILTWNRKDALKRHLDLLLEQTYPEPFEVIVCVDGSTDGTQVMLSRLKEIPKYSLKWFDTVNTDKNTAAQARNMGIKNASGEILIMVDDDCLPHKQLIESYLKEFNPQEVQVGYKSDLESYLGMSLPVPIEPGLMTTWMKGKINGDFNYFQTGNVCMSIIAARTPAKDGSIGFDERFVGYGHEDTELGRRLASAVRNFRFNPDAVTWHMHPGSAPQQDPELKKTQAVQSNARLQQILEEPFPYPITMREPSIKVGLFTSRPAQGYFYTLLNQLGKAGVPFEVGEMQGESFWAARGKWHREFLSRNTGKVCILDAWDTTFWGTKEELERKINAPIIFSAERNCWPPPSRPEDYPKCKTPWRFVNGGGFGGDAKELLRLLSFDQTSPAGDQYNYVKSYLSGIGVLDSRCRIWHNLYAGEHGELVAYNGRWKNTITGEIPCFIHGNGGSWKYWPDIFPETPVRIAEKIEGWMSHIELSWLSEIAQKMRIIFEIGSYRGRSTYALCSACPGKVYAVDQFQFGDPEIYESFLKNMANFQNLTVLKMKSLEAAVNGKMPAMADMIFLDADHDYEPFKADIKAWLPRARKIICGHDYGPAHPGVMQAVKEVFGDSFGVCETIWYVELSR